MYHVLVRNILQSVHSAAWKHLSHRDKQGTYPIPLNCLVNKDSHDTPNDPCKEKVVCPNIPQATMFSLSLIPKHWYPSEPWSKMPSFGLSWDQQQGTTVMLWGKMGLHNHPLNPALSGEGGIFWWVGFLWLVWCSLIVDRKNMCKSASSKKNWNLKWNKSSLTMFCFVWISNSQHVKSISEGLSKGYIQNPPCVAPFFARPAVATLGMNNLTPCHL